MKRRHLSDAAASACAMRWYGLWHQKRLEALVALVTWWGEPDEHTSAALWPHVRDRWEAVRVAGLAMGEEHVNEQIAVGAR